jgi:aldehyde dehydrogenase (NAD+)
MAKNYQNFIAGKLSSAKSKETYEKRDPADPDKIIAIFPRSGQPEVDAAVIAAEIAFPTWSATTPAARGKVLFEAAKLMEQKKQEIADMLVEDVGKTVKEAVGEVHAGIDMCYFMAGEGRRLYGETTHSELPNRLAMTRRYPIGVCGIITPWNFPWSLISWKVLPALICGNTVVLKPAADAPRVANAFAQILQQSGLPDGTLNVVHGYGNEAGFALVNHPKVKMISFTGSSEVGKKIARACASRLAKVSLELGGKNAVIVMDDCDLDLAVASVARGAFSVAGERCTATSRVIAHKDVYEKFLEKLLEATRKMKVGAGIEEKTDICPMINDKQLANAEKYVEIGRKEGARLLFGGKRPQQSDNRKGFYFEPTIFAEVTEGMAIAREEIFGPVLVMMKADSFDHAIELHNSTSYGLSGSIFTNNISQAMTAIDRMEAGVCYVNGPTFGSEVHLPFGGVKQSGNGHREVGKAAIETFSEWKTIYIDYSGVLQNAQFKK